MASQWFYETRRRHVEGPVSDAELRNLVERGIVTRDTLVWGREPIPFVDKNDTFSAEKPLILPRAQYKKWVPASRVSGLSMPIAAPPPVETTPNSVPVLEGYYSTEEWMTDSQLAFYKELEQKLEKGAYVPVDGQVCYLFVFVRRILATWPKCEPPCSVSWKRGFKKSARGLTPWARCTKVRPVSQTPAFTGAEIVLSPARSLMCSLPLQNLQCLMEMTLGSRRNDSISSTILGAMVKRSIFSGWLEVASPTTPQSILISSATYWKPVLLKRRERTALGSPEFSNFKERTCKRMDMIYSVEPGSGRIFLSHSIASMSQKNPKG